MFNERQLPVRVGEAYTLTRLLGSGGMAMVYEADVEIERFDFALVVAFRESAKGDDPQAQMARRRKRYAAWKRKKTPQQLRQICDQQNCPYPAGGKAAVKVLLPNLSSRPTIRARFEAEWHALMAIGSPHLVQVYSGGHDPQHDAMWYAMELLEDVLDRKALLALSVADKLSIAAQASLGLGKLHRRGVIHRDVKPDNILVTRQQGKLLAKVSDLGVAKTDEGEGLTTTGARVGTTHFIAPEQLLDGSRHAQPVGDVYSLGATLYHLLSGEKPYGGMPELQLMGRVYSGERPATVAELTEGRVPAAVSELVALLMEPDPARRPANMPEAHAAIIDCYEQLPGAMRDGTVLEMPVPASASQQISRLDRDMTPVTPASAAGTSAPTRVARPAAAAKPAREAPASEAASQPLSPALAAAGGAGGLLVLLLLLWAGGVFGAGTSAASSSPIALSSEPASSTPSSAQASSESAAPSSSAPPVSSSSAASSSPTVASSSAASSVASSATVSSAAPSSSAAGGATQLAKLEAALSERVDAGLEAGDVTAAWSPVELTRKAPPPGIDADQLTALIERLRARVAKHVRARFEQDCKQIEQAEKDDGNLAAFKLASRLKPWQLADLKQRKDGLLQRLGKAEFVRQVAAARAQLANRDYRGAVLAHEALIREWVLQYQAYGVDDPDVIELAALGGLLWKAREMFAQLSAGLHWVQLADGSWTTLEIRGKPGEQVYFRPQHGVRWKACRAEQFSPLQWTRWIGEQRDLDRELGIVRWMLGDHHGAWPHLERAAATDPKLAAFCKARAIDLRRRPPAPPAPSPRKARERGLFAVGDEVWSAARLVGQWRPVWRRDKLVGATACAVLERSVVVGLSDGTLRFLDLQTGRPTGRPVKGRGSAISRLAPTISKGVLVHHEDGQLSWWRRGSFEKLSRNAASFALGPRAELLAIGYQDKGEAKLDVLRLSATRRRTTLTKVAPAGSALGPVALRPDRRALVVASWNQTEGRGALLFAELANPQRGRREQLLDRQPHALRYVPGGRDLFVSLSDRDLALWPGERPPAGEPQLLPSSIRGRRGWHRAAASPDGRLLAWSIANGTRVYDLAARRLLWTQRRANTQPEIKALAWAPTGDSLLILEASGLITCWRRPE